MNAGLTGEEWKQFLNLIVKANDIQLNRMSNIARSNAYARKTMKEAISPVDPKIDNQ